MYTTSAPPPGLVMAGPGGYPPAQSNVLVNPHQGAPVMHVAPVQQPAQVVVMAGNCPGCHAGNLNTQYLTCCGILWAILLFPIGLLCLFFCSKQQCSRCGYMSNNSLSF